MRVMIAGANGFIGRHCLPHLTGHFDKVYAVRRQIKEPPPVQAESIEWHRANLLYDHEINDLFALTKPTHLIHLAWFTEPSQKGGQEYFQWAVQSPSILNAFWRFGGKRVLIAGSCAEYKRNNEICQEADKTDPPCTYGKSRELLRTQAEQFCKANQLSLAWARLFFPFGPHQNSRRLIPSTVLSLLKNEIVKSTNGTQLRDFQYVDDVAGALVATLMSGVEGPVNICSGQTMSVNKVLSKIADQLGKSDLVKLEARPGEPDIIAGDNTILSNRVGFKAKHDIDESLAKTIEWWSQNSDLQKRL